MSEAEVWGIRLSNLKRGLVTGPWKGMEPLFVYGTLMTGRRNNARLLDLGCEPSEPRAKMPGLDVYHVGHVGFPAVVKGDGTAIGEVWWLPNESRALLDRFEASYDRMRFLCHGTVTKRSYFAWVYVWKYPYTSLGAKVPSGKRWNPENELKDRYHA